MTSYSIPYSFYNLFFQTQSRPPPTIPENEDFQYLHLTLQFLKDGKRKDSKGRLHTSPDYDGRTLLVSCILTNNLFPILLLESHQ